MDAELPLGVEEIRGRIQAWRLERTKSEAMPSALWADAIELAKRLGINPASRVLGLNPTRLRVRMPSESGKAAFSSGGFLELKGTKVSVPDRSHTLQTPSAPSADTVIELLSGHGHRLTIRLGAGHSLDLTALVRAFRD